MPLPVSAVSMAAKHIRQFLHGELEAAPNSVQVLIGAPHQAAEIDNKHVLSLFFYSLEPSGFQSHDQPGEPWLVRLNLIITASCIKEGNAIPAGENDLRLLGEVVRAFHENPILPFYQADDQTQVRLQLVPQTMSMEQLSYIWSNQGDAKFRPSVCYQVSLVPVLPKKPSISAPLVTHIGKQIKAGLHDGGLPFSGPLFGPPIQKVTPTEFGWDWTPRLCFIYKNTCSETLSFEESDPNLNDFKPAKVWVAGAVGETVTLSWRVWNKTSGWQESNISKNFQIKAETLDPDLAEQGIPAQQIAEINHPINSAGQAMLVTKRTATHPVTGQEQTLFGNPLVLNLFKEAP